ncbi:MAG TPA: carbon-nitrogen hydrolase family protein [Puia sp.]
MEHKKIRVGVVQATPALFNKEKSIDIVISWIEKGSAAGCEFLLFPESFIPCYPRGLDFDAVIGKRTDKSRSLWLDYYEASVDVSGGDLDRLKDAIKKAGLYVALGVTEKENTGGSLYCSLLYFNRDGEIIGKHRKIKPTGLERYIWAESDGTGLVSFDLPIGKLGGLICWENYMPLARMAMFNKGVEIYLAPTADARSSWQATMLHIALEGRCFVLSSNQFIRKSDYPEKYQSSLMDESEIICGGGSVIYSPLGETLAGPLWNDEGLLVADLDFRDLVKSKLDFDVTGHYSRNDIFKLQILNQPDIKVENDMSA